MTAPDFRGIAEKIHQPFYWCPENGEQLTKDIESALRRVWNQALQEARNQVAPIAVWEKDCPDASRITNNSIRYACEAIGKLKVEEK